MHTKTTAQFRSASAKALAVVVFAAAALVTLALQTPRPAPTFDNVDAIGTGTHILAIFVASSTCGASEFPGLPQAMDDIRYALRARAERDAARFVSVGVSLDQDPWRGMEFLKSFGPFDEILAGGSWLNTGAVTFMLRDWPSRRAIPQLILVERAVAGTDISLLSVSDRVVGRKIGAAAIVQYARALDLRDAAGS